MKRTALVCAFAMLAGSPAIAQVGGSYRSTGLGCPGDSLLYEQFAPNTFDLSGTGSLDWFPNGLGGYIVTRNVSTFLPTAGAFGLFLGNETISAPVNLGFTLPYPTGKQSTTQVEVCSNGFVYLEPGTITSTRCCNGTGAVFRAFRNDTPSWAVLGMDLDPSLGGNVLLNTAPGVAYITWDQVPESGQSTPNTFQIQLFAGGQVSMVWSSVTVQSHTALVGWSGGGGVLDSGPTDLSAVSILNMGPSYGPLTLSAPVTMPPTIGKRFQIDLTRVPPDGKAAVLMIANGRANQSLDPYGLTGCSLLISPPAATVPLALTPPTGKIAFTIPFVPFFAGTVLETQAAVVSPSVNMVGVSTSNRGTLTIGDVDPVIVRAQGPDNDNDDTSSGFWQVVNATKLDITSVRFDWVKSSRPNSIYFDTNQTGMADRFDGGDSTTPLCQGTYRNDSDVITGLDYTGTAATPCGGISHTGWVGSGYGTSPGDYRTLDFKFTSFQPGEVFEFDADTDGGPGNGGAMAGMVVTIHLSDGSVRTGELVAIDFDTAEVSL